MGRRCSPIFGGLIGYQHQFGNFVLGVEANISGAMASGNSTSPSSDCVSAVGDRECRAALKDLFTVGPRLGWAHGNMLLYATGGYALGTISTQLVQDSTNNPLIRSKSQHDGWFLGAGVEWAMWRNVTVGLEYQRVHLGDDSHRYFNVSNGFAGGERATFESDTDIIRARLTFQLR